MSAIPELSAIAEMEAMENGLVPNEDWEAAEGTGLEDISTLEEEALALEPECRTDLPNCENAFVIGNPYEAAEVVDYSQGDNPCNAMGNCGLVSLSNMLSRAGYDMTEEEMTEYAVKNGLCDYDVFGDPTHNGATTAYERKGLLEMLGIESDICESGIDGTLEDIVDAIDGNRGVVLRVNAGALWNCDDGTPLINGKPQANHCVAVTGYARDAETGKVTGVFIADSGRGNPEDACRYLTVEEFDDVYTNVNGSLANITRLPLRKV